MYEFYAPTPRDHRYGLQATRFISLNVFNIKCWRVNEDPYSAKDVSQYLEGRKLSPSSYERGESEAGSTGHTKRRPVFCRNAAMFCPILCFQLGKKKKGVSHERGSSIGGGLSVLAVAAT